MASFTNTLLLELAVKNNKLSGELKKAGTDAKASGKALDEFKESARQAFSFAGSIGLSAGIGAIFKKSVNAYGEFINQVQTANAVFGDSFGRVEEAMKTSVEDVGLSKTAYLQASTYVAGLGKAAGLSGGQLVDFSADVVQLGADLAAAFNTDVEQAMGAIQSGFSGSSVEPLRRYNVVINDTALKQEFFVQTGEKVTGVLTKQQRAAAFMSLLYKETADFQGQWNKESQQFLGTQQRLTATMGDAAVTIGEQLEPAVTGAMNAAIDAVGAFESLAAVGDGVVLNAALMGAGYLALRPAFKLAGSAASALNYAFFDLVASSQQAGKSVAKLGAAKIGASLAKAGPAIGVAAAAILLYTVHTRAAKKAADEWEASTTKLMEAVSQNEKIEATTEALDGFAGAISLGFMDIDEIPGQLDDLMDSQAGVVVAMRDAMEASPELQARYAAVGITVEMLTAAIEREKSAREGTAASQQASIEALYTNAEAADAAGQSTEDAAKAAEDAVGDYEDFADALGDVSDAADDARENITGLLDEAFGRESTQLDATIEKLKIATEMAELYALAVTPLDTEGGETQADRDLAVLEQQKTVYDQIATARSAGVEAAGVTGQAEVDWSQAFLDNLVAAGTIPPELAAGLQADIDAMQAAIDVELNVLGDPETVINGILNDITPPEVLLGVLIDGGVAADQAQRLLDTIPEEKQMLVVAEVAQALIDADRVGDKEYTAELLLEATTAAAQETVDGLRADVGDKPGIMALEADINAAERAISGVTETDWLAIVDTEATNEAEIEVTRQAAESYLATVDTESTPDAQEQIKIDAAADYLATIDTDANTAEARRKLNLLLQTQTKVINVQTRYSSVGSPSFEVGVGQSLIPGAGAVAAPTINNVTNILSRTEARQVERDHARFVRVNGR